MHERGISHDPQHLSCKKTHQYGNDPPCPPVVKIPPMPMRPEQGLSENGCAEKYTATFKVPRSYGRLSLETRESTRRLIRRSSRTSPEIRGPPLPVPSRLARGAQVCEVPLPAPLGPCALIEVPLGRLCSDMVQAQVSLV